MPCTAACMRIPVCGDGHVDPPEQCDDGALNGTPGDGCSATCDYANVTWEVEPNNTFMQADAALAPITGTTMLVGSIATVGDVDIFRLDVNAQSVIRFETFDSPISNDCTGVATTLTLYSGTGAQLYQDFGGGIGNCSALVLNMPPGIYYVEVQERGNVTTIAQYALQIAFQTSDGNELEPNDTLQTANPFPGSDVYITGNHLVNTDQDWFAITVPKNGQSIRAEMIEGPGGATCESGLEDSRLTLYYASGVAVGDDLANVGRGLCSRMDGTGNPPAFAATNLSAGTYYMQVRASPAAQTGPAGQFNYRLVLTIRAP